MEHALNTPDFLCIGAQKAGTTWLYSMLGKHPDVWLGPFKEVQFFNSVFVKQHRRWTAWHVKNSVRNAVKYHISNEPNLNLQYLNYVTSLADEATMFSEEWYSTFFSRGRGKIKGDITPEYCTLPEEGIDYVLRTIGPVPIIYIIRDPLSRALSQLKMNIERANIDVNDKALDWSELVNDWDIGNRGDYINNITRWKARYPNDQLLFLPYGRVAQEPASLLSDISKHIGIDAFDFPGQDKRVFEGKKINLPQQAIDMMEVRIRDQKSFIADTFDDDFVSRI